MNSETNEGTARLPLWVLTPSIMSASLPDPVKYFGLYLRSKRAGNLYLEISKEEAEEVKLAYSTAAKSEYKLQRTAYLNRKGKEAETAGNVEEAIAIYESVIALGYVATHAYTRLCVLYWRLRQTENEIRIIRLYISVFSAENARMAEAAIREYPELAEVIRAAAGSEEKVLGPNGTYCFVPYEVNNYKRRLLQRQKGQN